MVLRPALIVLAAVFAAPAFVVTDALADTIVAVTSQSTLAPNDAVSWTQLGPDGTPLGATFNATSTGGLSVGGSFAGGGGQICDNAYDTCSYAFPDYSIEAYNTRAGAGAGPLTLTLPGVYGVGTNVVSNVGVDYGIPFSASLSLYNGATLLGTATAASDSSGDPVYLGAVDETGANVTSAVFSLTSIGTPASTATTATFNYNADGGHADPPLCSSLLISLFNTTSIGGLKNVLQWPQKYVQYQVDQGALMSSVFPITVPIALDPVPYANESPYIVNSTNAAQDTVDTNPSDLADFFIDGLDIDAPTNSSQNMPEPGTLLCSAPRSPGFTHAAAVLAAGMAWHDATPGRLPAQAPVLTAG